MTLHQVGSKLIYSNTVSEARMIASPILLIERFIRKASDMLLRLMRKEYTPVQLVRKEHTPIQLTRKE